MKTKNTRELFVNVLADAVQELYSGAKFYNGDITENGFFCDFSFSKIKGFKLTPENFGKIQKPIQVYSTTPKQVNNTLFIIFSPFF